MDDLFATAGDDVAVAAGYFFDGAVVCPYDKDDEQQKKQDDDPKLAAVFFFLQGCIQIVNEMQVFGFNVVFAHNDESSVSVCCFQRGRLKRFLRIFRRPFPFMSCLRRFVGALVFLRLLCCFDFVLLVLHQFLQH